MAISKKIKRKQRKKIKEKQINKTIATQKESNTKEDKTKTENKETAKKTNKNKEQRNRTGTRKRKKRVAVLLSIPFRPVPSRFVPFHTRSHPVLVPFPSRPLGGLWGVSCLNSCRLPFTFSAVPVVYLISGELVPLDSAVHGRVCIPETRPTEK